MRKIQSLHRIVFVLFLLILLSPVSHSQVKSKLKREIKKIISQEFFNSCQIGIDIYDLTADKPIFRKNEKLLLRPASTLKLLTTSASLLFLNDFRFNTSLYYTGQIKDSLLHGDIFIVGGLDPEFSSKDLDSLTSEIKKSGIKEINGNVIADISAMDSLFWGNGWMWDDDPNPTSPYLSALNINNNCVKIISKPNSIGKPAVINTIPETNYIEIINNSVTTENNSNFLVITRDWINRTNKINVSGGISVSQKPDTVLLNIFNPAEYFLALFKESLERNKISFNGQLKTSLLKEEAKKLFIVDRTLDSVIVNVNKRSENLSAEMLLRGLGLKYYGKPSTAINSIKLIDSLITLVGLNPKSYRITDGSGLSFYNLISAELLTRILKYMYQNNKELFLKLYNSLPVAGVDGTLKNRMKNSPLMNNLRGKTGSLSGVSALSGYLTNKSQHLIAFTILIQNYVGTSKFAREAQEKICEILYKN